MSAQSFTLDKQQDPMFVTGTLTTDPSGNCIVSTGLRKVAHVSFTLNGSGAMDAGFVPKWDIPNPNDPTTFRLRAFQSGGTAAVASTTFSFVAFSS